MAEASHSRQEQFQRLVSRIDEFLVKGDMESAGYISKKYWKKLTQEERLQMFELFTRPGIRFNDATKEQGVALSKNILQTSKNVSERMRAAGLLYLMEEGETLTDEEKQIALQTAEKVIDDKDDFGAKEHVLAATVAASQAKNGEEAAEYLHIALETDNPIIMQTSVIPTVRRLLPNTTGMELLDLSLEKLEILHQQAPEGKQKNAIAKIQAEGKELRNALASYVQEQHENIRKIVNEMSTLMAKIKESSDQHLKCIHMDTLQGLYSDLEKKYRNNIPTREWVRLNYNMGVVAHWLKRKGDQKKYATETALALHTLEQMGSPPQGALIEKIQQMQKHLGMQDMGKELGFPLKPLQ